MNGLMAQLLAALAAISSVFGAPVNASKMPDRPAIVQSAPASPKNVVSTNKSTKPSDDTSNSVDNGSKSNRMEIKGMVTNVKTAGSTTIITVGGQTVTIDSNTKVQGKLDVGANVQIEANKQANGTLTAAQVEVKKNDSSVKSSDDKTSGTQTKLDDSKDGTKSGGDDSKADDKSGMDKSGSGTSGDDKSNSGTIGDDKSGDSSSGKSDSGTSNDEKSGHK